LRKELGYLREALQLQSGRIPTLTEKVADERSRVRNLLARYETFEPSLQLITKYLEQSRQALKVLPESSGRAGLFGLADFLAQQTASLTVSI